MRRLASFAMRGYSQGVMFITVLAFLALLFPPLGILASAAVALATLRQGPLSGMRLMAGGVVASGVLGWLIFQQPVSVVAAVLVGWLPVWALAVMLRSTRALGATVEAAIGFGVLLILATSMQAGDGVQMWKSVLEPLARQFVEAGILNADQAEEFIARVAAWMPGILALAFYLQMVAALLLGRWWQSLLYYPGGFGEEFRALRMSPLIALLGLGVLGWLLLQGGGAPALVRHLALLVMGLFLIQGLAVAHGLTQRRGWSPVWLYSMYAALFIVPPYAGMLLVAVGALDPWIDFRSRLAGPRSKGSD